MLRTSALLAVCLASLGYSQTNNPLTITSAASSGSMDLTAGELATATGTNLAGQTASAAGVPWPTTLGGVTVTVQDSGLAMRNAGLLFVSAGQINFQVPPTTALGLATVTIVNGTATTSAHVMVRPSAPALFALNDAGVAAATAVRVVIPTSIASPVPVFECGATAASCKLVPIDPGVDAPVYLSLYGTGIVGKNVTVNLGKVAVEATYAGPQGQFPGLDQVNVPLQLGLRGAGEIAVTVTVDGVTSNAVKINVQ